VTALDPDTRVNTWDGLNLNELPAKPPVHPTLGRIGDIGLVYPGKRHVFSGPQESAKTLAAYLIGLEVGRQNGYWTLIDFEMGAYDARDRLVDLGATPTDLDHLTYIEPEEAATIGHMEQIMEGGIDLVVIDAAAGAYDLQGLDDNKRQDVEKLTRIYVRSFWRAGIATIFLDHVVKNGETRGAYAIGSERKVGGADVHLGFSVIAPISRGHSGLYKISTHKDRGGYLKRGTLAEMELHSHPDTHAITYELRAAEELAPGQEWMPTKVMQHLSELLEKQTDTATKNQLADLAGGTRKIALQAIDHLIRLGYATSEPGPRNSQHLTHQRPFTVLEWENQPHPPTGSDRFGTGSANHSTSLVRNSPLGGSARTSGDEQESLTGSDEGEAWSWLDELNPEPPF
jgi:hypothetical protein